MALRHPFPLIRVKQRIAIYAHKICLQALYPARRQAVVVRDNGDGRDHNHMLRTTVTKMEWDGCHELDRAEFRDEATFKQALRTILFSRRD